MDFYVIPPLTSLGLMDKGERYFCLSQLYLKNKAYRDFFKERVAQGKWVTLDNGAGDHDIVTREQVLEIARELQPSELIPLDILFDGPKTIENLAWTVEQMDKDPLLRDIEIFAVPQGKDLEEWMATYVHLLENKAVKTIGLSKIAVPFVVSGSKGDKNIARDRNSMFYLLNLLKFIQKPLHFLGAGEAWEFEAYKNEPLCRSTDSCFTVWGGMNGQWFGKEEYVRIPTPKDYFERNIIATDFPNIHHNIEYMRKITK